MHVEEVPDRPFELYTHACQRYPQHAEYPAAVVCIDSQTLYVFSQGECIASYPVSTSRHGAGERENSYKTPRGVHCVAEKIGADARFGEILEARKRTNVIAEIEPGQTGTRQDKITSRVLWLSGLEAGINQGEGVDSHTRYIYIHGTHQEGLIGQPASAGCIRMCNRDVMDIFDCLQVSSLVIISE